MIIYSMTATFGKLENETLYFDKGLNIIEAPNEWGKSTWCAFLLAMFYGVDTKGRSSRQSISDKERFQPWSGNPMEGRVELNWKGRDITIERTTRGRVPLGVFRAYETSSGLTIPELRGDNCGELILGVEQSVYKRSGYIRMLDMSITNDELLRSRLNDLVTTGDESGEMSVLNDGLRELKNRLQYHKNGLIPQLEAQIDELSEQINSAKSNALRLNRCASQLKTAESELEKLRIHRRALENIRAQQDQKAVKSALAIMQEEERSVLNLREICSGIPSREAAHAKIEAIQETEKELSKVKLSESLIEEPYFQSETVFGFTPGHAAEQAKADAEVLRSAKSGLWIVYCLLGLVNIAGAALLAFFIKEWIGAGIVGTVGLVGIWLGIACQLANKKKKRDLLQKYGNFHSERWKMAGEKFDQSWFRYLEKRRRVAADHETIKNQIRLLENRRMFLLNGKEMSYYYETLRRWSELDNAEDDYRRACENYQAMNAMARSACHMPHQDEFSFSEEETGLLIEQKQKEIDSLHEQIHEIRFALEKHEPIEKLESKKNAAEARLQKLKSIYSAVLISQETQQLALEELHRRFSPGITTAAQEYLSIMSAGKYNKLRFEEDFSAFAGNDEDTVLHSSLYRSEGTVDQIYFALRLAVSQELISEAPLILDDAFVRFDDERLKSTLQILKQLGETKQIILFSCQNREKVLLA